MINTKWEGWTGHQYSIGDSRTLIEATVYGMIEQQITIKNHMASNTPQHFMLKN
jgi:ATP-dependent phosphoenolpyruvate carboxykinase